MVDDQDNDIADGTAGELVVRADEPFAFATGYFGTPEKTVEAWRNVWFHTGDRVVRQPDGYFRFVDRLKDAIRRRGENISSFEVEQVLLSHPAVANAAAFRSARRWRKTRSWRRCHPASRPCARAEAELIAFLRAAPALLRRAALSRIRERVAGTENGKVQKYKLRERGVTERTWDGGPTGQKATRRTNA